MNCANMNTGHAGMNTVLKETLAHSYTHASIGTVVPTPNAGLRTLAAGRAAARAGGRAKGRAKGRAAGRAKGRAEGM